MHHKDIRDRLPTLAHALAEAMQLDALGLFDAVNPTLQEATVTMAITYTPKDGGRGIRVALSIGPEPDPDEE